MAPSPSTFSPSARSPDHGRSPYGNKLPHRSLSDDPELVALERSLNERRQAQHHMQNKLRNQADIEYVRDSARLVSDRQDELEKFCMNIVRAYDKKLADASGSANQRVGALERVLKEEVQHKLRVLADDSSRSKRFVSREVEQLTGEVMALKAGLLTRDPSNREEKVSGLRRDEELKSLQNQVARLNSMQSSIMAAMERSSAAGGVGLLLGPGSLGEEGVIISTPGPRSLRQDAGEQSRDAASGELSQAHNVGGGQGPYASKFRDDAVEGGPRERRAQLQIVRDLVDEAVGELGHRDKFHEINAKMQDHKLDLQEKYTELLDKFANFKYGQPPPKTAIEILNDLAEDKQAAAQQVAANAGGSGGAPENLAISRTLVERKQFLKLQEEVAAVRGFVMSSNYELHHQKEALRTALEQTMQTEKKRSQKEIAQLWEEKNAMAEQLSTLTEKLQESMTNLAGMQRMKDETVRNQVLDQCYSMQTIHQNEFRVVMRKVEELRKSEVMDKSEVGGRPAKGGGTQEKRGHGQERGGPLNLSFGRIFWRGWIFPFPCVGSILSGG